MPYYSATCYKSASDIPEAIELEIANDGLVLHFDDGTAELWPYSDCYAGQVAQGEAECIANNTKTDARIFTRQDIISAVKAAIKGEPFKKPKKYLFAWGPTILFGFLLLCIMVWYFAP